MTVLNAGAGRENRHLGSEIGWSVCPEQDVLHPGEEAEFMLRSDVILKALIKRKKTEQRRSQKALGSYTDQLWTFVVGALACVGSSQ